MQDLKDFKQRIVMYNTASINILHLESEIERDSYFTQTQVLNHSIFSQQTNLDSKYIATFFEKNNFLNSLDGKVLTKNNELKASLESYKEAKNQIFTENSVKNTSNFNSTVYELREDINNYSKYLESKIRSYNDNYDKMIESSKTSGFLIALISLVIFVLAYVKMYEDLDKLKTINDEIRFINKTLNNAEMVAGFGSWKINTVKNTLLLSDNFYRLIGCEPKSFEPSMKTIMEFIHPEDREEVSRLHYETLSNKQASTITYRYLLPDGTIRHMVSVGKFLNNSKGHLVKIGVNQDITELMKKTHELEENNSKLVAINSELESFNNIVSHDLQEPLRKIQMFISRIESKEFLEKSAETTISYFSKIKFAAQRMQNLMTDLVDYTRTIKADRKVENVNLNIVLNEILEELAFTIEEKKAHITIGKLPVILGTQFQIQQLFINLISNAIKYVSPNVSPIISIQLENFHKEVVNSKTISGNNYYKITVTDNGIGFEQQYAEMIFMLFKRLDTNHAYKGTGLGLAICKKIVDNHKGFITATSKINESSVFSIYLPK
ncbi:sensor histidine kinase [Flavobacterium sp. SM2513]|uniref:sensor histidine kinase n=1 Tax=Flavobacterium sp. SM2513 TaxID=3424766 RepID=UPI003D7FBDCE